MKRVLFKFKDGIAPECMNITGDCFDLRDGFIYVWNGEDVVAMVRVEIVDLVWSDYENSIYATQKWFV